MGLFSSDHKDDVFPRRKATEAQDGLDVTGIEAEDQHGEWDQRGDTDNDDRDSDSEDGGATRRTPRARPDRRQAAQETLLDPAFPEKQRARRRLIGAIALVLAAIIALPMLLDSQPQPAIGDIAINIPAQPAYYPPPGGAQQAGEGTTGRNDNIPSPKAALPADASHTGASNGFGDQFGLPPSEQTDTSAGQARSSSPAASATTVAGDANHSAHSAASAPTGAVVPSAHDAATVPARPGSRFVVQLGILDEASRAHAWVAKLKAAGVPAYVESKQQGGTMQSLIRVGPFDDRASAEAAVKKVRDAGLSTDPAAVSSASPSVSK